MNIEEIEIKDVKIKKKKPKKAKKPLKKKAAAEGIKKRAFAYFIDFMIIILIVMFINYFIPQSKNIVNLNNELNEITTNMLSGDMGFTKYLIRFSSVAQNLDKERIFINIINAIVIIVYFVIIPYFRDGKTVGLQMINSKIARIDKELLSLNNLLVRSVIINGLGYLLISLAAIYLLPANIYFIFISIVGLIQIFVLIISFFMVIYRRDNLGLQDLISQTRIVRSEKK